ncbi:MAG: putative pre6S rRNA nuclease [Verrucomicrobiota bacterium]|jgi:putative Holliday junction resolvase
MSSLPIRRRILGVDFGQARIGIAVSDELGLLAHPVKTIPASRDAARQIGEIVREKNVECVVIGLPRHMNGSVGEAAGEALAFAEKLRTLLPCEVVTWDERLTTIAANHALRDGGRKTRDSRNVVDQVAAQMILQGYLDGLQSARDRDREQEVRQSE